MASRSTLCVDLYYRCAGLKAIISNALIKRTQLCITSLTLIQYGPIPIPLPTIVWSANYVDNGAADLCKQETVDNVFFHSLNWVLLTGNL